MSLNGKKDGRCHGFGSARYMEKGSFDASDSEMEVKILGERILVSQENV